VQPKRVRGRPTKSSLLFAKGAHSVLAGRHRFEASSVLARTAATALTASVTGGAIAVAWPGSPRSRHAGSLTGRRSGFRNRM
jgi:hypothetical protein